MPTHAEPLRPEQVIYITPYSPGHVASLPADQQQALQSSINALYDPQPVATHGVSYVAGKYIIPLPAQTNNNRHTCEVQLPRRVQSRRGSAEKWGNSAAIIGNCGGVRGFREGGWSREVLHNMRLLRSVTLLSCSTVSPQRPARNRQRRAGNSKALLLAVSRRRHLRWSSHCTSCLVTCKMLYYRLASAGIFCAEPNLFHDMDPTGHLLSV